MKRFIKRIIFEINFYIYKSRLSTVEGIVTYKRSLRKVDKEYSEEVIDRYERLQRRQENKVDLKGAEKELELLLNKK